MAVNSDSLTSSAGLIADRKVVEGTLSLGLFLKLSVPATVDLKRGGKGRSETLTVPVFVKSELCKDQVSFHAHTGLISPGARSASTESPLKVNDLAGITRQAHQIGP